MTTTHSPTGAEIYRDQVMDLIHENEMMWQKGQLLLLNGDCVELNLDFLTRLVNAALARAGQQANQQIVDALKLGLAMYPNGGTARVQIEAAIAACAGQQAGEAAGDVETEMADRLRRVVLNRGSGRIEVAAKTLTDAASECDRFYNGMMAWKRTAQEKDQIIIDLRAQLASAQKDAEPVISSYDIEEVKSLKVKFVDSLIHSGIQYRTCGAISAVLNQIIDKSEDAARAQITNKNATGE